jgi:protein TonB
MEASAALWRTTLTVAIASLHAMIIYVLGTASPRIYRGPDTSVIDAEVIPLARPISKPPSLPPVMLHPGRPIAPPALFITIDLPPEPAPVPASEGIETRDSGDHRYPVAVTTTPPDVDPFPVIGPVPISGPRGVDRYPNASMKARESGAVVMKICVSPEGKVDSVELAHSSGFPRLDQVALGIASEYRFQPATRRGHPVAACALYWIAFKVI